MGPIELGLFLLLPTFLILIGAGILILRRKGATVAWAIGILVLALAAIFAIYYLVVIFGHSG